MEDRIVPTLIFTISPGGFFSYGPYTTMAELKRMLTVVSTHCQDIKLMYIAPMNSEHWHRMEIEKDVHVPTGPDA